MALSIKSYNDLLKSSFYNQLDKSCDAVIVAEDGTEFKVHKLILSMRSGYFRSYFRAYIHNNERLSLAIDKGILENILLFIYTDNSCFNDQNIGPMIIAADYLLIDDLLEQCKKFAFQEISIENCISLLNASHIVDGLEITKHCYRFLQIRLESIVHSNSGIEELPYAILKNLLIEDSLGVTNEETVWKAIELWVNGDKAERLKLVPELLKYIRWDYINYNIVQNICKNRIIQENAFCESIDFEKYVSTSNYEMVQSATPNYSPKRCPSKMNVFLYRTKSGTYELYLTYDGNVDIWRNIGETNQRFRSVFTKSGFIYMFNRDGVKAFDLLQKTWIEKDIKKSFHHRFCVAQSENGMFVVKKHRRVKFYNPIEDSWKFLSQVPQPIAIHCGAIINSKLYVIGYHETLGRSEIRGLVYDIISDHWSEIEAPRQLRSLFAIINFRDQLYVFGGENEDGDLYENEDESRITLVEIYNVSKNKWEKFPSWPFMYEYPLAMIVQDKLMVYDNSVSFMNTDSRLPLCVWNETAQTWDVNIVASSFTEFDKCFLCYIEDQHILLELSKENKHSDVQWTKSPFGLFNDSVSFFL